MKTFFRRNHERAFETLSLSQEWEFRPNLTKKERKGLNIIKKHAGKRLVFETYLETNPLMAEKYLDFISHNLHARYIRWDSNRQQFTVAS